MILVIDNYDSFVHNLARYFRQLGLKTQVVRNDKISVAQIRELNPAAIVISPGPCTPDEAGCSLEVVKELGSQFPILGVCLGHQAIIQSFGGEIVRAPTPIHGRSTLISHHKAGVFCDLPTPFTVGRYHSLIASRDSLPDCLNITAETTDGIIMAVEHCEYPIVGLQFHPESILTEHGHQLLRNFAQLSGMSTCETAGGNV